MEIEQSNGEDQLRYMHLTRLARWPAKATPKSPDFNAGSAVEELHTVLSIVLGEGHFDIVSPHPKNGWVVRYMLRSNADFNEAWYTVTTLGWLPLKYEPDRDT